MGSLWLAIMMKIVTNTVTYICFNNEVTNCDVAFA